MQTIFVQIKCELGEAYRVADELVQTVEQVSEVYSTSGQYDLLIKCYLPDGDDIGRVVTAAIQRMEGAKDTFTLITFKAFSCSCLGRISGAPAPGPGLAAPPVAPRSLCRLQRFG